MDGEITDGDVVEVLDQRQAFLGKAYVNRRSLICARLLTRGRDPIERRSS